MTETQLSLGRLAAYTFGLFLIGLECNMPSTAPTIRAIKQLGKQGFGDLAIARFEESIDSDAVLTAILNAIETGGTIEGSLMDRISQIAASAVLETAEAAQRGGSC
jgi:hypothetical protein